MAIGVTPAAPTVASGTTLQFHATAINAQGTTSDVTSQVTWSSSNPAAATIAAGGLATSIAAGTTTITATLQGTVGTSTLTVSSAVLSQIQVTAPSSSLAIGTQSQLTATGIFSDGSSQDLTSSVSWSAAPTTVATVSNTQSKGLVTSVAAGSVVITATDSISGKSGSIALVVTNATLRSIAITPTSVSIATGTTQQLTATGTFSDDSTQPLTNQVTWSSSNAAVATISASGLATAASSGVTTIAAKVGTVAAQATLTVTNAMLVSIAVTPPAAAIANGTSQQFTATGTFSDDSTQDLTAQVTWSSSKAATASISNAAGSQGLATAVTSGSVTITATSGTISGTAVLAVSNASLVSIAVTPQGLDLARGTTQQLTAIGTFSDTTTQDLTSSVDWSLISAADAGATVATISADGLVTTSAPGSAVVTATFGGITGTDTLFVSSATLVSIAVTPSAVAIAKGTSQQFAATATYTDGTTHDVSDAVSWTASLSADGGPGAASITPAGLATGNAPGSSVITATEGSVAGTATLSVTSAALVSIAVSPPLVSSLPVGSTQQYTATGTFSDTTTQNLTSSVSWTATPTLFVDAGAGVDAGANDGVGAATIVAGGLATAVTPGGVTITATQSGVSGSALLGVSGTVLVSIAVSPPAASIANGTTQRFTATGKFSDGSSSTLTTVDWSVATNPDGGAIAAIDLSGLAIAHAAGTTTVTALDAVSGISGTAILSVSGAILTGVSVSPPAPTIANGTTQQFTATGSFSDGSTQNLTSSVTWAALAVDGGATRDVISAAGLATGQTPGAAVITASQDGFVGSATLDVSAAALVSIVLTPSAAAIADGTTQAFSATGVYSDESQQPLAASALTWSATPGADGGQVAALFAAADGGELASALSAGSTTVSAVDPTTRVSGTAALSVTNAVLTGIAVTAAAASVPVGQTDQLTATGTYSDSSTQDLTSSVTWTSPSTADGGALVASVSARGLLTGDAPGSASVTATLGSISGTASIGITGGVLVSIAVSPPAAAIAKGTSQQFSAMGTYSDQTTQDLTSSVVWSIGTGADGGLVASISSAGDAMGSTVGTVVVTATDPSTNVSGTASLSVTAATLTGIAVTAASPTVPNGNTDQLTAMGTYSDGSQQNVTSSVIWTVASFADGGVTVATVSGDGLLAADAVGSAVITATLDGVAGNTTVVVTAGALESITVSPSLVQILPGGTQAFAAQANYSDGTHGTITTSVSWTSSNTGVATMASNVATGHVAGSATITATDPTTGIFGSAGLAVGAAPSHLPESCGDVQDGGATADGDYVLYVGASESEPYTAYCSGLSSPSPKTYLNLVATSTPADPGPNSGIIATGGSYGAPSNEVTTYTRVHFDPTTLKIDVTDPTYSETGGPQINGITSVYYGSAGACGGPNGTFNVDLAGLPFAVTGGSADWGNNNPPYISDGPYGDSAVLGDNNQIVNGSGNGGCGGESPNGDLIPLVYLADGGPALLSISISPSAPSIAAGATQTFQATGTYSDGSTANLSSSLTWTSSSAKVATMASSVATGVGAGTATITATDSLTTLSASTTLDVEPAASSCPIPSSAQLAWQMSIPLDDPNYRSPSQVVYAVDNRASLVDAGWSRIGYCLTLDSTYAYAEMDDFTGHDTALMGVPVNFIFDESVDNLTVRSNVSGVSNVSDVQPQGAGVGGFIQMWSNCYGTDPATGHYDGYADVYTPSSPNCYGTLEVADATTTVFAWNRWSGGGGASDLGIGNQVGGSGNPDWTFAQTAGNYSTRTLSAYLVSPNLVSIAVSPSPASVVVNNHVSFTAMGTYDDGSTVNVTSSVTWGSSNPSAATITSAGVATGVGAGSSTITATLRSVSGTSALTVSAVTLVSIAVTPPSVTLTSGTTQLTATGTYSDNSTQNLTDSVQWFSSNTASVTVSNTSGSQGLVSFVGDNGSSTIYAVDGSVSGYATVQTVQYATARLSSGVVNTVFLYAPAGMTFNTNSDYNSYCTSNGFLPNYNDNNDSSFTSAGAYSATTYYCTDFCCFLGVGNDQASQLSGFENFGLPLDTELQVIDRGCGVWCTGSFTSDVNTTDALYVTSATAYDYQADYLGSENYCQSKTVTVGSNGGVIICAQ